MQRRQVGSEHRHFTNLVRSSTIDQYCGSGSGSGWIGIIFADPDRQSGPAAQDLYPDPDPNQFQPNVILYYAFFRKFIIRPKILKMMTPITLARKII
jgi:hypothetical protein